MNDTPPRGERDETERDETEILSPTNEPRVRHLDRKADCRSLNQRGDQGLRSPQKSKIFGGPERNSPFERRDEGVDGGTEIFGANGRGRKRPAAYGSGRSEGEELMGRGN